MLLLGLTLLVLSVWLFIRRSKTQNRQPGNSTPNNAGATIAQDVYYLLIENGFTPKQARFITAQAGHETGNFKSRLFKENNNMFGMKNASLRPNKQSGVKNGYGYYTNLENNIKDFALYYDYFLYKREYESIESYIKALKEKGYFTAPIAEYTNGAKWFYDLYFA